MKKRIIRFLKHQSFQPGPFSVFLNPFFFIRRNLFLNLKKAAPLLGGKLLDFGCGRKPYENLFAVSEYIGLDMEQTGHDHKNSKIDVFYDGKKIPFSDQTFDSLFCSEVLEHVFNPDDVLPEMNRVMKKGGQILVTVPFCWNEHEIPYDYARYSSFGIKHLLEKHGFKVKSVIKSGDFIRVNFQLWSLYFYEQFKKIGPTGILLSLIFIVPINIAGSLISFVLPRNDSFYFNTILLAEKKDKEW